MKVRFFKNFILSFTVGFLTMILLLRALHLDGVELFVSFIIVVIIIEGIRILWLDKLIRKDIK